jgi:DNA-binding LacI/PurR family transcriptional regulator
MADVAALAGVSHQTVSRVLNDHPSVRPSTRERVLAAIAELGYRPNVAARALATARSGTLGILTMGSAHYGPASTVLAVEAAARARGYFVSISSLGSYDAGSARSAVEHLLDQRVEGLVVVAPIAEVAEVVDDLVTAEPVVVVAAIEDVEGSTTRHVYVDQRLGARLATEHLLDLGHTRVAHVSGPSGWVDAQVRRAGWREVLHDRGLQPHEYEAGDWTAARGYEVGLRVAAEVAEGRGPTAVFAGNDMLAQGMLRALWEQGVVVPRDVSVVGFDDLEGSGYLVPALTTVRQPFHALGQAALQALLAGPDDLGPRGPAAAIAPELVVRGSTAPPGTADAGRPVADRAV